MIFLFVSKWSWESASRLERVQLRRKEIELKEKVFFVVFHAIDIYLTSNDALTTTNDFESNV